MSLRTSIHFTPLAFVILGLTAWLCSCSEKTGQESEALVSVQAVRAQRSEIQQKVTSDAVLYPLQQASIVPKISAPVFKFYVDRGEHVQAGQLLAVLENRDLAAAVAENKGAYEEAQANYESAMASNLPQQIQKAEVDVKNAKAALQAAQQMYDGSKKLYEQGALAKVQLTQAEVGLTQAQTQLQTAQQQLDQMQSVGRKAQTQAAQGQLAAAKGRYEGAEANLAYSEVRSPISGVVTDRPLYPGEMASTGAPLITVMNLSRIIARAHVPALEAAPLELGDSAEISAPGFSKPVPGRVIVVSPALDPDSTTIQVWVEAPNPHDQLKAGATVSVTIRAKNLLNALIIPRSAVLSESSGSTAVMVIGADSIAHQKDVKIGIEQDGKVQITEGLKEGELIVSQGAFGLPDGTKVKY